jgi:anti-sigma-K factor RskA
MTPAERDDLDALAGEYVLGLLDSERVASVERRLETDAALRHAVAFWQDRLLPLALTAHPLQPAPAQWASIARALSDKPSVNARRGGSFWDSLRFWRWTSALAIAGVCALAFIAVLRVAEPSATYIAVLAAPDRSAGWVVQAEPGRPLHLIPLVDTPTLEDRSLQFWTLVDKAQGPVSLGLVTPGRSLQVPASSLPGLVAGQLFEITLEPYGGSPVGRPTGAILWKGLAVRSR